MIAGVRGANPTGLYGPEVEDGAAGDLPGGMVDGDDLEVPNIRHNDQLGVDGVFSPKITADILEDRAIFAPDNVNLRDASECELRRRSIAKVGGRGVWIAAHDRRQGIGADSLLQGVGDISDGDERDNAAYPQRIVGVQGTLA